MREILTLSELENKVRRVVDDYLSFDLSGEHAAFLPSLLWSTIAL
jgi:hypothetical protein